MQDNTSDFNRLIQTNRRLKMTCLAMGGAILLMLGVGMQDKAQAAALGSNEPQAAIAVDDYSGFAVFAREDGNLVIVHADGKVIETKGQPMSVRF